MVAGASHRRNGKTASDNSFQSRILREFDKVFDNETVNFVKITTNVKKEEITKIEVCHQPAVPTSVDPAVKPKTKPEITAGEVKAKEEKEKKEALKLKLREARDKKRLNQCTNIVLNKISKEASRINCSMQIVGTGKLSDLIPKINAIVPNAYPLPTTAPTSADPAVRPKTKPEINAETTELEKELAKCELDDEPLPRLPVERRGILMNIEARRSRSTPKDPSKSTKAEQASAAEPKSERMKKRKTTK